MTRKDVIRRQIRTCKQEFLASHSIEQQQRLSEALLARIEEMDVFAKARCVLAYYSLPDEVWTHSFVTRWSGPKRIILPKVAGDDLTLHLYAGPDSTQWCAFGIEEPTSPPFTDYSDIDLVIVPGLAFDASGNRLGRGRGYYDRLFANTLQSDVIRIGLCYPFQLLYHIPTEPTDIAMHFVVADPK